MSEIRQPAGQPVGGQFASHNRAEATMTLTRPPIASAKDVQSVIDNALFAERERAEDDERAPQSLTWRDAVNSLKTLDDDALSTLVEGNPLQVRQAFNYRASQEGLETPLPTVAVRRSSASHLSLTDDQHVASGSIDERLTEYDNPSHYSRADYAEVTEDGIAYGYSVNPEHLGEVVAGPRQKDESADDYLGRIARACPDYWSELRTFVKEEYGAELVDDGGEMDIVEFYGIYEDGDATKSTLEYMGDRVERETKLLDFKNDWEYGTKMQSAWAKKLGYHFVLSTGADRQVGDGRWVKEQ